ncbi:MAG: YhcH/YjgK/YiaL family protein [Opitutae bacterium]|nr:YhcH/YjgK/YiaL family protein [Opitutae bacterium]
MAIFGPFSVAQSQTPRNARFAAAFAYVREALTAGSPARRRIEALAEGGSEKIELTDGVFAIEQVYRTKPRPEGFFESHRKYIDVQVVVTGAELMEVEDISRLTVSQAYDPERDYLKYVDTSTASRLIVRAGDVAVFYPTDGHMPTLQRAGQSELVRKTVVKVAVD